RRDLPRPDQLVSCPRIPVVHVGPRRWAVTDLWNDAEELARQGADAGSGSGAPKTYVSEKVDKNSRDGHRSGRHAAWSFRVTRTRQRSSAHGRTWVRPFRHSVPDHLAGAAAQIAATGSKVSART